MFTNLSCKQQFPQGVMMAPPSKYTQNPTSCHSLHCHQQVPATICLCWMTVATPSRLLFLPFHSSTYSALNREIEMIRSLCCSDPGLALHFSLRKAQVLTVAHQALHEQAPSPLSLTHSADLLLCNRHTPSSGSSLCCSLYLEGSVPRNLLS